MNVAVTNSALIREKADAWVLFCFEGKPPEIQGADAVSRRLAKMVSGWIKTTGFKGTPNEISVFPCWEALPARFVILAGLGKRADFHPGRLDRAAASAARRARKLRLTRLAVSARVSRVLPLSPEAVVRMLAAAFSWGSYDFTAFRSPDTRPGPSRTPSLVITDGGHMAPSLRAAASDGAVLGEILAEVRDVANLPGNEAPPRVVAQRARALARKHGVSFALTDQRRLRREGCHALLAVGRGSPEDPCVVTLAYRGTQPRLKPVVLVGKTITFDTGGISLKHAKDMEWMKYDKCGGMAVLAAVLAASRLRLRRPVVAILAAAENMPDGRATRPGDIVRARSGKTIEIINTDAEGRLVLADALSLAASRPAEAIVDLATLTGACIVALGHVLAAVVGNDAKLVRRLQQAGEESGDRLWPMPLLPEYGDGLRSHFADLKNVAGDGAAGTIVGGAFLQHFVPEGVPWAHVDIAGTAWEERDQPYAPAGATLFGARLLVQWIRSLETH